MFPPAIAAGAGLPFNEGLNTGLEVPHAPTATGGLFSCVVRGGKSFACNTAFADEGALGELLLFVLFMLPLLLVLLLPLKFAPGEFCPPDREGEMGEIVRELVSECSV